MASARKPVIPLTEYQKATIGDRARFIFDLWSRQSGKSFGAALAGVLGAAERKEPWVWLSSGERASKELIEKGAMHARAIGAAAKILEEDYVVEEGRFTSQVLQLPGGRIVGLPANPATARGHSANVLLDEFATHRDSRAIWTALFPTITRGYRLRIATTPLGKQNKAYDLWTDWSRRQAAGDLNYSCRKVTINDAVAGGLILRDHEGNPTTPEQLREALADDEAWAQEYLCDFLDEATAWLSYDLIGAVEVEDLEFAPRWSALLLEEAVEQHKRFLRTKQDTGLDLGLLEDLRGLEPIYGGVDIGRKRDLTVIWPMIEMAAILRSLAVLELARQPFWVQQRVLFHILALPGVRRFCIDATGIGAQLAEAAQERFGEWKVEAVTFTVQAKEAMSGEIRKRFEDRALAIPAAAVLRNSLHSVKRLQTTTGHFRFDAERSEQTGHCYDAATELLTRQGWMHFADLSEADEIASLRDGVLTFERPTECQRFEYDGEMIRILNKQVDLLVTPNHRLWIRLPHARNFGFMEARLLVGTTAPIEFAKGADWHGTSRANMSVGDENIATVDWLRFLGAFLCHGFTSTHYRIGIYAKDQQTLAQILRPLPWAFWEEGGEQCHSRRIKNRALWEYLRPLGRQPDRYIPRELLDLPADQIKWLLDGLMWGQGQRATHWAFTTSSQRLANDLQELALRLGMAASVRTWQPSVHGKNRRTIYRVNFNRERLTPQINRRRRSVSLEEYSGQVYCCTVPSGLLYVRRNGVPVWCGNSDHYWSLALACQAASTQGPAAADVGSDEVETLRQQILDDPEHPDHEAVVAAMAEERTGRQGDWVIRGIREPRWMGGTGE